MGIFLVPPFSVFKLNLLFCHMYIVFVTAFTDMLFNLIYPSILYTKGLSKGICFSISMQSWYLYSFFICYKNIRNVQLFSMFSIFRTENIKCSWPKLTGKQKIQLPEQKIYELYENYKTLKCMKIYDNFQFCSKYMKYMTSARLAFWTQWICCQSFLFENLSTSHSF